MEGTNMLLDEPLRLASVKLETLGNLRKAAQSVNKLCPSKEEHEASVCLCRSQICRSSYLNFSGEGAFEKVLMEFHGVLDTA
ncbi:hypothetical protein GUJ93_ZPchr0009g2106 [Zizania palustris]|uniref:ATXR3 C-terminal domain-containing protein n=1 Tax=Zizania palustris TaxID=103762 RepID=A0A8J5VLR4_ZIZPA|nr:hypothetical protein GUJ93_ZPchr0009g2106 [Zizania palustris]